MTSRGAAGAWSEVVGAVAVRPDLWATALGQVFRLSPTGWWRRPPFAPVPDPAYVRFRVATQYGGGETLDRTGAPHPHDVIEYLQWCRSLGVPRTRRASRR
jgi:hypothetical protein